VMLVSHDRALLREVCDEFWLVTQGGVKPFDGDLDDYQRWLLDTAKEQAKAMRDSSSGKASAAKASATASSGNRKEDRKAAAQARLQKAEEVKPLRKELNKIDNRLGVLFGERDEIEALFATNTLSPEASADKGKKLKLITDEIEKLEGRWLEVSTKIDEMTSD